MTACIFCDILAGDQQRPGLYLGDTTLRVCNNAAIRL